MLVQTRTSVLPRELGWRRRFSSSFFFCLFLPVPPFFFKSVYKVDIISAEEQLSISTSISVGEAIGTSVSACVRNATTRLDG